MAGFSLHSQNIEIQGKVTDSLKKPLVYSNVIASAGPNSEISFAITDDKGFYRLKLKEDLSYEITVSYLGYLSQTINVNTNKKKIIRDFILETNTSLLDEVELNYTPPITIKKDTIIYLTDKFITGKERRLKDVLKKLPGVEVNKSGQVLVQGKIVTKVLVEGKLFFTGDSKLAVNNIPANAVDKIEILDNYSDIAMLKGLQDSDDIAMNVKLKENKKKFVFGDVTSAGGIEKRYQLHSNLFYYSPKTTFNFIGDINNAGFKSFTYKDYLNFEGGLGKLITSNSSSFNSFNNDFSLFARGQSALNNISKFGALNIRRAINESTDINTYVLSSSSKNQSSSSTINQYLNTEEPLIENRLSVNNAKSNFTIGTFSIESNNSKRSFISNSFVKIISNNNLGIIDTESLISDNIIKTRTNTRDLTLKQNINYTKQISETHTGAFQINYNYKTDKPERNWKTNQQILQGIIPLENDSIFNIFQNEKVSSHNFNVILKDYWTLNNSNHLYPSIGVNMVSNDYYNEDFQQLSNGAVNNFSNANFGNNFNHTLINIFLGIEYRFQIGMITIKPALYYNSYNWKIDSFLDYKNKSLLLPQLKARIEFSNSEKIDLAYRLNTRFASVDNLGSNFMLSSFNQVFKGNIMLENELYHTLSLRYSRFSLFRKLNVNGSIVFTKRDEHFKNIVELEGINQFNTPILVTQPEYNYFFNLGITKKINIIKYRVKNSFTYNDFFQVINESKTKNISRKISSKISAETFFEKLPNMEIGYGKDFNSYTSFGNKVDFTNDSFFMDLEYNLMEDFVFNLDYTLARYKSERRSSRLDNSNVTLNYQSKDGFWEFEALVSNLFNNKFKVRNSFSNFLISENKAFIQPRIFILKFTYKF